MRLLILLILFASPSVAWAQDEEWDDWGEEEALPVEIHGLLDMLAASRLVPDATQPGDLLASEARFRLDLAHFSDLAEFAFKGDVIADAFAERTELDIRQALLTLQPSSNVNLRLGRQVMTWGTGDLVFLNDLFPKDFIAFFIGRSDEFLKAPANAFRGTLYGKSLNLDLVWLPRFSPDRYITGERLSFFDPMSAQRVGMEQLPTPVSAERPAPTWRNSELAARLYRTLGSYEVALYGYTGFSKQPTAFDTVLRRPTFAPLTVYGGSIRGVFMGGISHMEGAYYDSRDDREGTKPTLPNSQLRALVGHEREIVPDVTLGLQYYVEHTLDHDALLIASASPGFEPSETRHVLTSRWTYRLRQQTLTASLFTFWSPNDGDGHLRPGLEHQWSDTVVFSAGANLFFGKVSTFFGQLENNTGVYVRARYSF